MTDQHPALTVGRRWADAERAMAADQLEPLLAQDFMAVGPLGFVLTRAQWLDRFRSGLHNSAFDWQDVQLRDLGDTVITIGVQDQQTTYQGRDSSGRFRVSHVFVRRQGGWRIAHLQLSGPLLAPAQPRRLAGGRSSSSPRAANER